MLRHHKFFGERSYVFMNNEDSDKRVSRKVHLIVFPLLVDLGKEELHVVNCKFLPLARKQNYGSILGIVGLQTSK